MTRDPRYEDRNVEVLAFYYPGEEAPCDRVCHVPFLSNLWPLRDEVITLTAVEPPLIGVDRRTRTYRFGDAEAAHQALVFWNHAQSFEQLDGRSAIDLNDRLMAQDIPDWSYGGYGDRWDAMVAVLKQKFRPGTRMAHGLRITGGRVPPVAQQRGYSGPILV
jgi:hypothetical protein